MSRSAFLPAASLAVATLPWAKSLALVAGLHAGLAGIAAVRLMLRPRAMPFRARRW